MLVRLCCFSGREALNVSSFCYKPVFPDWRCVVGQDMHTPVSIPVGGQGKWDRHSGADVHMDSREGLGHGQ